jgi:hypothetical protein
MWATIVDAVKRNLLLFVDVKQYALVTACRLAAISSLVLLVKLAIAWDGTLPKMDTLYITSIVLALFSVGLSCGFYVAANRAARDSQTQLQQFLGDMRAELRNRFSDIQHDISKNQSPLLANLGEQLRQVEANPGNEESKFAAFETVLKEPILQLIILMHEKNVVLDRQLDYYPVTRGQAPWQYELANQEGGRMGGTGGIGSICNEIADTGLLQQDMRDRVTLTDLGHRFAAWLAKNGKKATYFKSTLGGWGEQPESRAPLDAPTGFPGWPFFGHGVTPESQAGPPPAGGAAGDAVVPPDFPGDFLGGMRSVRSGEQQPNAAATSSGPTTQTGQACGIPGVKPGGQPVEAIQPSSTVERDGKE